jgi:hypothetical protein
MRCARCDKLITSSNANMQRHLAKCDPDSITLQQTKLMLEGRKRLMEDEERRITIRRKTEVMQALCEPHKWVPIPSLGMGCEKCGLLIGGAVGSTVNQPTEAIHSAPEKRKENMGPKASAKKERREVGLVRMQPTVRVENVSLVNAMELQTDANKPDGERAKTKDKAEATTTSDEGNHKKDTGGRRKAKEGQGEAKEGQGGPRKGKEDTNTQVKKKHTGRKCEKRSTGISRETLLLCERTLLRTKH